MKLTIKIAAGILLAYGVINAGHLWVEAKVTYVSYWLDISKDDARAVVDPPARFSR